MKSRDDPTIARIRAARHRISQRCGHDPHQVVDYYIELQKKYQNRLLVREPETAYPDSAGSDQVERELGLVRG